MDRPEVNEEARPSGEKPSADDGNGGSGQQQAETSGEEQSEQGSSADSRRGADAQEQAVLREGEELEHAVDDLEQRGDRLDGEIEELRRSSEADQS